MTKTIHAIYEHGVLRPLNHIEGLEENTELELTISTEKRESHPILRFAGIISNEEADEMMKVIEDEFERINLDEWKD
ncbi:MAG: antitoxin family protein [Nitrospinae bacterium]|nr:antitoxin family protein [Nitrospinota bacterium]